MNDPATPAESPLRIERLVIDELFGPGSPPIDVAFKLDARVTVLHGRNGSGKTITLRLLEAIREGRFEVLAEYPFKSLRLELSSGESLTFEPEATEGSDEEEPDWKLRYELDWPATSTPLMGTIGPTLLSSYLGDGQRVFAWAAKEEGAPEPPEQLRKRRLAFYREDAPKLCALLDQLPEVKFIRADRLFVRRAPPAKPSLRRRRASEDSPQPELMVEQLSEHIRQHIVAADRQYRLISTRLDSSLPSRLFADHGELPSLDELERRDQALREQTERLLSLGLLREQPEAIDRSKLSEDQKKTFFIILEDREQKLAPFASIAAKAQRLLDSLNRKLAPKSVCLDVETGYQVFSANGSPLPLRCLSSGEQHELVLLHELLFDVRPGSLILIDEPELSLHVTWQEDVLPDLLAIAELADLDIVLATHSPYIVGKHDELMVRLGEPV